MTCRAKINCARLCLGQGDEFFNIFNGKIDIDQQDIRRTRHKRNGYEVLHGIVRGRCL